MGRSAKVLERGGGPAAGYARLLDVLRERIRGARVRAALAVNHELVLLYWQIGGDIRRRQREEGWGAKVVARLAADLRSEFPEMTGLSRTNLLYMRAFAEAYPAEAIVQQLVGRLPWGHNVVLLDKVKAPAEREWYARGAVEHGWSRAVLVHQIESGLYRRQGHAVTNFERTLAGTGSELAREMLKDPYHFDFLSVGPDVRERELEAALLAQVRDFLLELGVGFALVGSQHRLEVGGQDFYLDLLFYHLRLRCYVVVELKLGAFRPEDSGKMGFYLTAVDEQLRHEHDRPSIGLILCRERNRVLAEYALRSLDRPIGVAEYRLTERLPAPLRANLPSTDSLARRLAGAEGG